LDLDGIADAINENTAAFILNSPNNPSGAVVSETQIKKLSAILRAAEDKYGHPIYLISDEPYRELVYDQVTVPFLTHYYNDTVICYSYSKSLSLPGERIGYLLVNPACADWQGVYAGLCGAGRALGFVCAPALFQHLLPHVAGLTADLSIYKQNRDLLYGKLTSLGFTVTRPDGAFYLFVKSPIPDARAFSEAARKHELLLVPSDSFGVPGYLRISYCLDTDTIRRALPAFELLAKEFIHE
jgi:aspartate aminotransferase